MLQETIYLLFVLWIILFVVYVDLWYKMNIIGDILFICINYGIITVTTYLYFVETI